MILSQLANSIAYAKENLPFGKKSIFMAMIVDELGESGQREVERCLGWSRTTVRKGKKKLEEKREKVGKEKRGRKKITENFPELIKDIKMFADPESQTDSSFKTRNLYTRVTAKTTRKYLIKIKGYTGTKKYKVPSRRTISKYLNEAGYRLKRVQKQKPIKKIPETDKIFEEVHKRNREADQEPKTLRLSMDAKAKINIGSFSRKGKNRRTVKAVDHDFQPDSVLHLWGISLPAHSDVFFYFSESGITSDLIIDCLEKTWKSVTKKRKLNRLLINLDNGMENSSKRTQFIKRLVIFAYTHKVAISLAYYPPYHSKYNHVERVWGALEQYWNGELLESREKVIGLAKNMTWKGKNPAVQLLKKTYEKGISVPKKAMELYEGMIQRLAGLERWFLDIAPEFCTLPSF